MISISTVLKNRFLELDGEAILLVEHAWDRKLPLTEKLSDEITRKDLLTLKGLDWLNDEVINFYMNLICERSKNDESLPKVSVYNYIEVVGVKKNISVEILWYIFRKINCSLKPCFTLTNLPLFNLVLFISFPSDG